MHNKLSTVFIFFIQLLIGIKTLNYASATPKFNPVNESLRKLVKNNVENTIETNNIFNNMMIDIIV